MALISGANLIRSVAAFHLTMAYFLCFDPASIAKHNLVSVLSIAMGLPNSSRSFDAPSALSSLFGAVLAFFALADLFAASMHEEIFSFYWSSQVPLRVLFFFVLAGGSYAGRPGGIWAKSEDGLLFGRPGLRTESLSSGPVFTWAFVQLIWWFWVYNTIREERREFLRRTSARSH